RQLGVEAIFAGTTRTGAGPTAAAHAVGELRWSASTWGAGVGAGPSTGLISGGLPVTALHTRARLWWRPSDGVTSSTLQLSVEPTHFPDGWFTDASAGATFERGRAIVSVWTVARLSSTYTSTAAGSVSLQFFVRPRVSLELAQRALPGAPSRRVRHVRRAIPQVSPPAAGRRRPAVGPPRAGTAWRQPGHTIPHARRPLGRHRG